VNEKGATVRIEERYREAWVQSRLTVQDYEEFLRSLPGAWQHDIEQINRLEAENERLQETEEGILHAAYDALKMLEAGSPDTAAAILRGRLKGYPPFQRRVDDNSAR
jgi:hypothetical protein